MKRILRACASYILANASVAVFAVLGLFLYSAVMLASSSRGAGSSDIVTVLLLSPLMNLFVAFLVLAGQSLPWLPALIWAADKPSQRVFVVAAAPIFGAALFWIGALAAEEKFWLLTIWTMPFGYAVVAALGLGVTTVAFFWTHARLDGASQRRG